MGSHAAPGSLSQGGCDYPPSSAITRLPSVARRQKSVATAPVLHRHELFDTFAQACEGLLKPIERVFRGCPPDC